MSWTLLVGIVLVLGLALLAVATRRRELVRMERSVQDRERAEQHGSAEAQLQHPVIDLSRCLGCGTCVEVCPEEGVLDLVHGQAVVVNGARCVGVSACERECPVGAITITLGDTSERKDIPAIDPSLEAVGSPGLFLAGEVTAHALIKTAVEHGTAVGAEVARRVGQPAADEDQGVLDLCIVGAGPAGLACALEAHHHGLRFVGIDQEEVVGGTVAKYPRRKLVMTQPVALPMHGRLGRPSYEKEELVDLWHDIVREHDLPIEGGQEFVGLERADDGSYRVHTRQRTYFARHVCLALGRRGVPRRLGVDGEDLPKVAYSLMDAHSYQGRRVLVVGGGDSAVEAAMGLAEQPGNSVTLSYRRGSFFRIRARNEERLAECIARGTVRVVFESEVVAIRPDAVDLAVGNGSALESIPNDDVFVMAGGTPPFELLTNSGVSFDASDREHEDPIVEQGTGLTGALAVAFGIALMTLVWAVWHADYYLLSSAERVTHEKHALLRPGLGLGLWMGIVATALICVNLLYLLRRAPRVPIRFGSLQSWMTSHVATGVLALLCAVVHSAMSPEDTPGGHAFWALAVLTVTGAIGRYFYAYVPRAANGRELALAEAVDRLGSTSEEWGGGQTGFRARARASVQELVEGKRWRGSFLGRVLALLGVQRDLRRVLAIQAADGRRNGISEDEIRETARLARQAHRSALMVAHYEDLRAVLNTWRWVHRWVAALMVLLIVVHVVHALVYGSVLGRGQ